MSDETPQETAEMQLETETAAPAESDQPPAGERMQRAGPGISAPAPQPSETTSPVAVQPHTQADVVLASLADHLMSRKATAAISILSMDQDGNGATLKIAGEDLATVRYAAISLMHEDDGRAWEYRGDGPDLENGTAFCFVHVSPFQ